MKNGVHGVALENMDKKLLNVTVLFGCNIQTPNDAH